MANTVINRHYPLVLCSLLALLLVSFSVNLVAESRKTSNPSIHPSDTAATGPKKIDLLLLGDSTLADWTNDPENVSSWQQTFGYLTFASESKNGYDTIDWFENRFHNRYWQEKVRAHYLPKVVVISIGTGNLSRASSDWLNQSQGQGSTGYLKARHYNNADKQQIELDMAAGTINTGRGVINIIREVQSIWGKKQKILVVAPYPTLLNKQSPDIFYQTLQRFVDRYKTVEMLNPHIYLANIGWSQQQRRYYVGSQAFPESLTAFSSIHTDWEQLNPEGYQIFAQLMQCHLQHWLPGLQSRLQCPAQNQESTPQLQQLVQRLNQLPQPSLTRAVTSVQR